MKNIVVNQVNLEVRKAICDFCGENNDICVRGKDVKIAYQDYEVSYGRYVKLDTNKHYKQVGMFGPYRYIINDREEKYVDIVSGKSTKHATVSIDICRNCIKQLAKII